MRISTQNTSWFHNLLKVLINLTLAPHLFGNIFSWIAEEFQVLSPNFITSNKPISKFHTAENYYILIRIPLTSHPLPPERNAGDRRVTEQR